MRSRVPDLMAEKGWTAYRLHKQSGGRITMSTAQRLARGEWAMSARIIEALCDVFGITDPGPLFAREDPHATLRRTGAR